MAWEKLTDCWYICEYGCFNAEGLKEERCHHSSDKPDDGETYNAAHWRRTAPYTTADLPHSFLCNYHYEELVLRITGPTDDEIKAMEKALEPLSAEEFSAGIGEVK